MAERLVDGPDPVGVMMLLVIFALIWFAIGVMAGRMF